MTEQRRPNIKVIDEPATESVAPTSQTDSRYISITDDLPSKFVFYEFDSLSIRPLTVIELKKIFKAHATRNFIFLIEAIGATIDRPIMGLTMGDFWYLLYWQRINSYKRSPFVIDFECSNDAHNDKVAAAELEASTLKNSVIIDNSTLQIIDFDETLVETAVNDFYQTHNLYLHPNILQDFSDIMAAVKANKKIDEEDDWLNKYASLIDPRYGSLSVRRKKIEDLQLSPDDITAMEMFEKLTAHGVKEEFTVKCKECNASQTVVQSIDALQFFPAIH